MTDRKTIYDVADGAAWITLNSPDNRNALSALLVQHLEEDLDRALSDPQARCIVLTGAGVAFCAGADLKEAKLEPTASDSPSPFVRVLQKIMASPKPVIAVINGAAFAGGLGLVAAADIAIAADTVKFSFSEVRIGVIPAIISVVCVPKLGIHRSTRLFLTGMAIDAHQAVSDGLIHAAVPVDRLADAVRAEVAAITRGGPNAVAECKALIRKVGGMPSPELFAWTERKSADMFAAAEAQEGMAAFREKRAPNWIAE
jgi:methylglutaconyl-CoA hydratase